METARVDIRKLQLLNDRISQCLDALAQVRLSVHGLGQTASPNAGIGTTGTFAPFTTPPMAGYYGGLSHTALGQQLGPQQQLPYGLQQQNPFVQQQNPFAQQQNPFVQQQNPFAQQQNPFAQQQNPYIQQQQNPYIQQQQNPYIQQQQNPYIQQQNPFTQQQVPFGFQQQIPFGSQQVPFGPQQLPFASQQYPWGPQQIPIGLQQQAPFWAQQQTPWSPVFANPMQGQTNQVPGWGSMTGLSHTGTDPEAIYTRPLWADPVLASRVRETFPYAGYTLSPFVSLF